MPLAQRQQLFEQAFRDPNQSAGKDILAFQEWTKSGSLNVPQPAGYNFIAASDDNAVLYNTNKFKLISQQEIKFKPALGGKNFQYIIFEVLDGSKRNIAVINTHFQGGPGNSPYNYNTLRTEQFKEITDFIENQQSIPVSATIICGDLNTDINQNILNLSAWNNALHAGAITARKPGASVTGEAIDYILYQGALQQHSAATYYPDTLDALLSHGNQDDTIKTYFSDHKIVTAYFRLPAPTAAALASQPTPSPVIPVTTPVVAKPTSSMPPFQPAPNATPLPPFNPRTPSIPAPTPVLVDSGAIKRLLEQAQQFITGLYIRLSYKKSAGSIIEPALFL